MDKSLFYKLIKPYAGSPDNQGFLLYYMQKVKISINGENRVVIIPMEYNEETDVVEIKEVQIEPMPDKDEDISKDLVMYISQLILAGLNPVDGTSNQSH